jgi:hypothetical protein
MRRFKTLPAHSCPRSILGMIRARAALRCLALPSISAGLLALAAAAVSPNALAQSGKKQDDDKGKTSAGSMDSGDPVDTEKSDDGPFKPKGKTGEVAEQHEETVEIEEVIKAKPRDKLVLFGEVLVGFGKAPPPPGAGDQEGTGDGTSVTLQVGGRYDLKPNMSLGLRVPWTTANIDDRYTRQSRSTAAFGSPELGFEYRVGMSPRTTLPIFFGVGIPIAQGNPDRWGVDNSGEAQAEANLLADAASGWKDGELFMPKRLPLVAGVGLRHERRALEFALATKLAVLPNIGTELTNPGALNTPGVEVGELVAPGVALRNVTTAAMTYEFLEKPALFAGLDLSLVYYPIPAVDLESASTGPSPLQLVFEPRVGARFGKITPGASYVLPIGGQLADAGVGGLRLHVDVAF